MCEVYSDWWTESASPKAWMSVRDADLLEEFLHCKAQKQGSMIRVLEWGCGRSTLWYPRYLEVLGLPYLWVTIEHDHTFCEREIFPKLPVAANIVRCGFFQKKDISPVTKKNFDGLWLFTFDAGLVRPDIAERIEDRMVNLDAYVELPKKLDQKFDVIIIDGRKRRRCLQIASEIVETSGYVLLHDAWREYYFSSMSAFTSGRRFGDEWWIGSVGESKFIDILPWHAFEKHLDKAPLVPIV